MWGKRSILYSLKFINRLFILVRRLTEQIELFCNGSVAKDQHQNINENGVRRRIRQIYIKNNKFYARIVDHLQMGLHSLKCIKGRECFLQYIKNVNCLSQERYFGNMQQFIECAIVFFQNQQDQSDNQSDNQSNNQSNITQSKIFKQKLIKIKEFIHNSLNELSVIKTEQDLELNQNLQKQSKAEKQQFQINMLTDVMKLSVGDLIQFFNKKTKQSQWLDKEIEKNRQKYSILSRAVQGLQEQYENNVHVRRIAQLEKQNQLKSSRIQSLQQELSRQKNNISVINQKYTQSQNTINDLQQTILQKQLQIDQQENQIQTKIQEIEDLKDKFQTEKISLQNQNQQNIQKIQLNHQSQLASLEKIINQKTQQNQNLKQKIQTNSKASFKQIKQLNIDKQKLLDQIIKLKRSINQVPF